MYTDKNNIRRKRKAIYAGSFDPITMGHVWIIKRSILLFDELIIVIGVNPDKKYTFSSKERTEMIESVVNDLDLGSGNTLIDEQMTKIEGCKISVVYLENEFLIDFAAKEGIDFIVRGIRNVADYEFERKMSFFNSDIHTGHPVITTIALMPPAKLELLSSSFVKSLCGLEYWQQKVRGMVPELTFKKLLKLYECPDWTTED